MNIQSFLRVVGLGVVALCSSLHAQNFTMSNAWSIAGGQAPYVTASNNERGIAYNPVTKHLLIVSRSANLPTAPAVMVLDPANGSSVGNLSVTGVMTSGPSITFSVNMIGVADDGAIYVCDLTQPSTATTTNNFVIYRWADETASPTIAFQGQIGALGSRWGDNFDVRGSGATTQILAGQGDAGNGTKGKSVAIFTTTDGSNFVANVIASVNGATSDFNRGISFGKGNSIYSKAAGTTSLKYSVFDLNALTLSNAYTFTGFDANLGPLTVSAQSNLLGMVRYNASASTNQYVNLYLLSADASIAPILQDTKFAPTNLANANGVGSAKFGDGKLFAFDSGNSLMAFTVASSVVANPPVIVTPPASQRAYEGAPNVTFAVSVTGTAPFQYAWQKDGANIPNATNATLVLTNITIAAAQGNYQAFVTNSAGSASSSVATLMLQTPISGPILSNTWNLLPLSRPYLGDSDFAQRGLAYNPVTGNLLLASRTPTNQIVVLNSQNGAEKYFMNVDPSVIVAGGSITFPINTIGVGDDGVVYGVPLVIAGSASAFRLYAWNNDSASTAPELAFIGDPGNGSNLRWGDSFAVRGGGVTTQILLGPGSGSSVSILTTADGLTFSATPIAVTDGGGTPAPSGFANLGAAWGADNTFWVKTSGGLLRQVQFDLASGTGTIIHAYNFADPNTVPSTVTAIGVDVAHNLLAGLSFENPDNVQLFDIADLVAGPKLVDQELFTVKNANGNLTGVMVFGGSNLFALDSNNGIKAFSVNPNAAGSLAPFTITKAALQSGSISLTWQSVANHIYQVQYKNSLTDTNWSNAGTPITASDVTTSYSEPVSGSRFYRVSGQ